MDALGPLTIARDSGPRSLKHLVKKLLWKRGKRGERKGGGGGESVLLPYPQGSVWPGLVEKKHEDLGPESAGLMA